MKINKRDSRHWLFLFISAILIILFLPVRFITKKKSSGKTVILYGHKLHGNINSLYTKLSSSHPIEDSVECYFLTLDPSYYSDIKSKKNILFALHPLHLFKAVMADCIVTDHGLHTLVILLKFTDIKFADVWHGIPFKGFIPEDFKIQHQYDEIWVSSELLRKLYIDKFKFKEKRVFVTGYGRTDLLLENSKKQKQLKNNLKIPLEKKIILFAPTWKQDDDRRNEIPFGLTQEEFLASLQRFALDKNIFLIFRFHLNSTLTEKLNSSLVAYLPLSEHPDTEEILAISDILITDWSSIAFDMMALEKPIVFLDVPAPFKNNFSLSPQFRVGDVVSSFEDLLHSLDGICTAEANYLAKYQEEYQKIRSLVYDDTVDGKTGERYMHRLKSLM